MTAVVWPAFAQQSRSSEAVGAAERAFAANPDDPDALGVVESICRKAVAGLPMAEQTLAAAELAALPADGAAFVAEGGMADLEAKVRDVLLPTVDHPFHNFQAHFERQSGPKELLVSVRDPKDDAILQLEEEIGRRLEPGEPVAFAGTVLALTREPDRLTFRVKPGGLGLQPGDFGTQRQDRMDENKTAGKN
jgi:hypothetical protein